MKRRVMGSKRAKMLLRIAVALLVAAGLWGVLTAAPLAAGPSRVDVVGLTGITGGGNNVAFAYDRFLLVAPYAPTAEISDDDSFSKLDNHYLYLIDSKKPNETPKTIDLTTLRGETVYYPSRVVFDPDTSRVYVRGTRYEQTPDGVEEIEVIAYVYINLDDNGKPFFNSNVVVIDIKGIASEHCGDAPLDFALGRNGNQLVFTNGASIFTYNVGEGYIYEVDIVPPTEYSEDSRISYLDVDHSTNVLTVCWNRKTKNKDDRLVTTSELSFYILEEKGALTLFKRAYPEQFPVNDYLPVGSNVAISSSVDKAEPDSAFFVTSNGSLCEVDLNGEGVPQPVKALDTFPELAQKAEGASSPRLIRYDASRRVVTIVEQGFTAQIRRPAQGRPGHRGGIVRSLNAHILVDQPAMVLARLNKRNKVVDSALFTKEFANEGGLSNFVVTADKQLMLSTYSGNLFAVNIADEIGKSAITSLGNIGSRVDKVEFFTARSSLVAISSVETDETGEQITSPGSLVIARFSDVSAQAGSFLQAALPGASLVGAPAPSIRRPCNIKN